MKYEQLKPVYEMLLIEVNVYQTPLSLAGRDSLRSWASYVLHQRGLSNEESAEVRETLIHPENINPPVQWWNPTTGHVRWQESDLAPLRVYEKALIFFLTNELFGEAIRI